MLNTRQVRATHMDLPEGQSHDKYLWSHGDIAMIYGKYDFVQKIVWTSVHFCYSHCGIKVVDHLFLQDKTLRRNVHVFVYLQILNRF